LKKTAEQNETLFKPRYSGRAAFSLYFWPVSLVAFVFLAVDTLRTSAFYSEGLLTLMFALAAFSPPFLYFREMRFGAGEELVVKRYFLPDVVMPYKDIISFQYFSLRTAGARIPLSSLNPQSFEELDKIIDRLIDTGKIKLKKKR
jgi:hypothetical protein